MTSFAWKNALGGNWGTQGNWTPSTGYPVGTDTATISLAGPYNVNATGQTLGTVTLNAVGVTLAVIGPSSETVLSVTTSFTISLGTFEIDASSSGLQLVVSGSGGEIFNHDALLMQGPLSTPNTAESVTFDPSIANFGTFKIGQFNQAYLDGTSTANEPGGTLDVSQGGFVDFDQPTLRGTGSGTLQNAGSVLLGGGASVNLYAVTTPQDASAGTLDFVDGNQNTLTLNDPTIDATTVTSTIVGFRAGDTIDVAGVVPTGSNEDGTTHFDGATLTVTDSAGTTLYATLSFADVPADANFAAISDGNDGFDITTDYVPCFAAATRIATTRGEIAVEDLRAGDCVLTPGGARPVAWIGQRRIDLARHPRPDAVRPICIQRAAFGPATPARDLLLSPDHAVFWDDVLIEVKQLVNASTITQCCPDAITYYHVELSRHDILFAEGLPCESYLDTGNRGLFENARGPLVLHPDLGCRSGRLVDGCAPILCAGPKLVALRRHLLNRATALGFTTSHDPAVHLLIDGSRVAASILSDGSHRFMLSKGARDIRLRSRTAVPAHLLAESTDTRRLGVAVTGILLHRAEGTRALSLDDAALAEGWYPTEYDCRWTDGDSRLDLGAPALLEIRLARMLPYALPGRRRAAGSRRI